MALAVSVFIIAAPYMFVRFLEPDGWATSGSRESLLSIPLVPGKLSNGVTARGSKDSDLGMTLQTKSIAVKGYDGMGRCGTQEGWLGLG